MRFKKPILMIGAFFLFCFLATAIGMKFNSPINGGSLLILFLAVGLVFFLRYDLGFLILLMIAPFKTLPGIPDIWLQVGKQIVFIFLIGAWFKEVAISQVRTTVFPISRFYTLLLLSLPLLYLLNGLWQTPMVRSNLVAVMHVSVLFFLFHLPYFIAFKNHRRFSVYAVVISCILLSTASIYGIITYHIGIRLSPEGFAIGSFGHQNTLGMFLTMLFPIILSRFLHGKLRPFHNNFLFVVACLTLYALYLTHSRGSVLTLLLSTAVLFWHTHRKYFIIIVCLSFFIGGFITLEGSLIGDIKGYFRFERGLSSRPVLWQAAFKMIEEHPFTGIGPNMFKEKFLEYKNPYNITPKSVIHPHNLYIRLWLDIGIVGTIFSFMLIGRTVSGAILGIKRTTDITDRSLASALFASFVGIYFHEFFEASCVLGHGSLNIIFWSFVAMSELFLVESKERHDLESSVSRMEGSSERIL